MAAAASADDEGTLPMRTVLQAHEVVAAGRVENTLQVPSPIYTAEFTDSHHVLIGAGGGGRKFGMANIALLLRVQSLRSATSPTSAATAAPKNGSQLVAALPASSAPSSPPPSSSPTGAAAAEPPVWGFAAALDLGVDIPWCTSAFLPYRSPPSTVSASGGGSSTTDPGALGWSDKQRQVLEGLDGFIALSSIAAFTLIGVYCGHEPTLNTAVEPAAQAAARAASPTTNGQDSSSPHQQHRYLRQLARITVPHDDKDPDKKPIALAQNLLLVAHDLNEVIAFSLTDLVPDCFEDEDEEKYIRTYAAQMKPGGTLQRRVPRVVVAAAPVAEWHLPARVNDLSVNRVCIVQAESTVSRGASAAAPPLLTAEQPHKAHLHEHLVLAALLQNKTVALTTLRLRRKYASQPRCGEKRCKREAKTVEGVGAAAAVTTTLTLTGAELPLPFKLLTSSLRLVRLFGWNNIDAVQQAEMRRRLTWQSLLENGTPTHGPLCSLMLVAFNSHTSESFIVHAAVRVTPTAAATDGRTASSGSGEPSLALHWASSQPSPVLSDAITSLAFCTDAVPGDYEARVRRSPVGAAVPTHIIAGTVEGWVASVRWNFAEKRWHIDHVRPSSLKSVAKRYPALHKEPVSCVAVSAENDVVSADIAQNIVLTAMPYALLSPPAPPSSTASKPSSVSAAASMYVVQPRLTKASMLFPTSMSEAGVLGWIVAELTSRAAQTRALLFLVVPLLLLLMAVVIMVR